MSQLLSNILASSFMGDKGIKGEVGSKGDKGELGLTGDKGSTGSKGDSGSKGDKGEIGATGATGSKGDTGNFGGAAFDYTFDTGTSNTNPGVGTLAFNNATLSSANKLFINNLDDLSANVYSYLQTIDDSTSTIKGHFTVTEKSNTANFTLFTITGNHLHHTNYFEVPVSYVSGVTSMSDALDVIITFARTGDVGDKGNKGDTGSTGTVGDKGATGDKGDTGQKGDTGSTGAKGDTGSAGTTGSKGEPGTTGSKGDKGDSGGVDLGSISNTQILFNDSGNANGSSALTFNKSSNTINVGGNIVPTTNVAYDLGTSNNRFKDIYLSNSTIYLGSVNISSNNSTLVLPEGTVVGTATVLAPRIANVQVANSSWSALDDAALDTAGGYLLLNGAGFQTGINVLFGNTTATAVTRVSSTQLRVTVPALTSGSYSIYATNPDGGLAIGLNLLATSNTPVWSTGASLTGGVAPYSLSVNLSASESADTITYSNVGSLPAGLSLTSNGVLSGTLNPGTETTYNFTIRATDQEQQDADRLFSVTITVPITFAGTFAGTVGSVFGSTVRGAYITGGIVAGNNIVLTSGSAASACGSFSILSGTKFSTVVAHNKQGNVAWSKSHIIDYNENLGGTTEFFGQGTSYNLSAIRPYWTIPNPRAVVDSQDNVYTAFSSEAYYGSNNSLWIIKYNSSGTKQWVNRLRNNYANSKPMPFSIAINSDGNLIVGLYRWHPSGSENGNIDDLGGSAVVGYMVSVNSASGAILSNINVGMAWPINIKPIANTNNIVTTGCNYGYAAIGISNTNSLDSYANLYARRYYNNNGTSIFKDTAIHSNGSIYALGTSGNGQSLNVLGWSNTNLNNGGTYSWNTSFANSDASRYWSAGQIKLSNNYLYITATESGTNYTNCTGYVIRLHAGNGAIDFQKSITANGTYSSFLATSIDLKEDKMYISGGIDESNTSSARTLKTISLVIPSNGYSNSSSSSNIQYEVPGIYGNNKIVYSSSSLSAMGTNSYTYGDACTGLAYLSSSSNSMVSNTTANNVYDISESNVHYSGDTTGGYYNSVKISNSSSNTVILSF